jgi:hypothetical protein
LALAIALAENGAVLEVVPTLDRIDPVDVTCTPVAQTQNSGPIFASDCSMEVHLSSAHTNYRWRFQCKVKCAFAIK